MVMLICSIHLLKNKVGLNDTVVNCIFFPILCSVKYFCLLFVLKDVNGTPEQVFTDRFLVFQSSWLVACVNNALRISIGSPINTFPRWEMCCYELDYLDDFDEI